MREPGAPISCRDERIYTDEEIVELLELGLRKGVLMQADLQKESLLEQYTIGELERMVTAVQ